MENEAAKPGLPLLPTSPVSPRRPCARSLGRPLVLLAVCGVLFGGGYALVRWTLHDGHAAGGGQRDGLTPNGLLTGGAGKAAGAAPKLFVGWTKPDFALVVTGQTFGYLQPCGCSYPQYGGLARRWELINSLKQKGWSVVPLDLGDLFSNQKSLDTPAAQNLLKYETAMLALHAMGYHAIGIGKQELAIGLNTALGTYSLNNARPRPLAANLVGVEDAGLFHAMNARPFEIIAVQGLPRIGVVGAIGKSLQDAVKDDPNLKFAPKQMADALAALKQQADFNVMLFQTVEKQPLPPGQESEIDKCVKWCAEQTPLHVVVHSTDDPEPPFLPTAVGPTQVLTVGHKGKYVGVLGVWKKNGKYETKYQPVLIGPEFEPKPGNPVAQLMEEYTKRVRDQNLIAKYLQTPHRTQAILRDKGIEARYIGSDSCSNCHEQAHDVWTKVTDTKHSHALAFKTLVNAKDPGLRQFDGECMQCHTTGFKHDTGYNDPQVQQRPGLQKKLLDVGCESCHGPGSAHANNPKDEQLRKLINPWAKHHNPGLPEHVRLQRINNFCQTCHDIENDDHWDFETKWPKVIHMNTPAKGAAKGKKK